MVKEGAYTYCFQKLPKHTKVLRFIGPKPRTFTSTSRVSKCCPLRGQPQTINGNHVTIGSVVTVGSGSIWIEPDLDLLVY